MTNSQHHDPIDVLGEAYEKMYERVVENIHKVEDKSGNFLHHLIDEARLRAIELRELTDDEAELVAQYLKRDLSDTVNYLSREGHELRDWLGFETTLLESDLLYLFDKLADPTTLALLKLKLDAEAAGYNTGEITGPGTLACDACGEKLHFHRTGRIPPCPRCEGTHFHRLRGDEAT